jgi:hypothetical protein
MFVVLYTANLYICEFMICSTSHCLYDTLMDPWNVCIYQYVMVLFKISYQFHSISSLNFFAYLTHHEVVFTSSFHTYVGTAKWFWLAHKCLTIKDRIQAIVTRHHWHTQGRGVGGGRGCSPMAPPPAKVKLKITDFIDGMISKGLCDVCFSLYQPLGWWLEHWNDEEYNKNLHVCMYVCIYIFFLFQLVLIFPVT